MSGGAGSLEATTDPDSDEGHARGYLDRLRAEGRPHAIAHVLDSTQLTLGLRLTLELRRRGVPLVVLATQHDALVEQGRELDTGALEEALGVPVIATSARDPEARKKLVGYAESSETEVEVRAAPAPAAVLDFRLSRGARLTGQVVQRGSRSPLEGARVTVERQRARGGESSATPAYLTTLTDRLGRFSLFGLPAGEISLLAAASGHHGRVFGRVSVPEQGEAPPVVIERSPTGPGEEPRLELAGIGVVLEPKGEHIEVRQVLEGGGAAEAGVRPGDLVLAVDGRPVTQLGFDGSLQAIRGPEGTMVTLTLRRGDVAQVLVVSRRLVRR